MFFSRVSICVVLFCLVSLPSCKYQTLEQGMVEFDEAFIPAWFYVLQNDLDRAYPAYLFLEKRSIQFQNDYQKFKVNDDWDEHFRRIGDWLKDAKYALKNQDQHNALMALDHVRYELMELRLQHGSNYYLDRIWGFEILLDEVVEIAQDPLLCLVEYQYFEDLVTVMNDQWVGCLVLREELEIFEFSPEEEKLYARSIRNITNILVEFNEAVACGDGEMFSEKASEIWPAYLHLISVFGDFESSNTNFAAISQDAESLTME